MNPRIVVFCVTCVAQRLGRGLSEAEARLHKDSFPDHKLTDGEAFPEEIEEKEEVK